MDKESKVFSSLWIFAKNQGAFYATGEKDAVSIDHQLEGFRGPTPVWGASGCEAINGVITDIGITENPSAMPKNQVTSPDDTDIIAFEALSTINRSEAVQIVGISSDPELFIVAGAHQPGNIQF